MSKQTPSTPPPGVLPPPQRQMSAQEMVQNMRDAISLAQERAKDQIKGIFDNIIQQLAKSAQMLLEKDSEISRLNAICKDNNIDTTPKPPKANRADRRRATRAAKKQEKKVKKKPKKR